MLALIKPPALHAAAHLQLTSCSRHLERQILVPSLFVNRMQLCSGLLQAGYAVDECGMCGGSGDSCALVLRLQSDSLASTSGQTSLPHRVSWISIDVRIPGLCTDYVSRTID